MANGFEQFQAVGETAQQVESATSSNPEKEQPSFDSFQPINEFDRFGTYSPNVTITPEKAIDYQAALPETLNIAGIDTPIELSKEVATYLVTTGHMMSDTYRGIKQILGIDPEEEAKAQSAVNLLYKDPDLRSYALAGGITGAVAEPLGVILPGAKGKSLWNVAKLGATTGMAFGGLGYVDEQQGQTRVKNMLFGGLVGGTLSPTIVATGRGVSRGFGKIESRAASKMLDNIQHSIDKHVADGVPVKDVSAKIQKQYGLNENDILQLALKQERKLVIPGSQEAARRTLQAFEDRVASGSILTKAKGIIRTTDPLIEPLVSSVSKKSQKLGNRLRKMDFDRHQLTGKWMKQLDPFLNKLNKIDDTTRRQVDKALYNGDVTTAEKIMLKNGGKELVNSFKQVRKVLKEVYDEASKVGYKIEKKQNYFPRIVEDVEGLSKVEHTALSSAMRKEQKRLGRQLTPREAGKVIENLIYRKPKGYGTTASSLLHRSIGKVNDEILPYYAKSDRSLVAYIHDMAEDVANRKFFRDLGYKNPPDPTGGDLDKSIQKILQEEVVSGNITPKDASDLVSLLRSRFSGGRQMPQKAIQDFKNVTYAVTLGNPLSAMTQFGDITFSIDKFGVMDAVSSLFGRKLVKREILGILDAVEELASSRTATKKLTDWSLKWGQFNRVDSLGKNTLLTAALKSGVRSAKNAKLTPNFKKKWGKVFEGETDSLIDDLSKVDLKNFDEGMLTDNIKLYLWNELADVQPIALSEMPKKYLDSPNGRVLYMLRSFTIKQLDYMRRKIRNAPNKTQAAKDFAKFATLFVAANSTVDMAKDFVRGKEIKEDDILVDNMWTLVGVNKFTVDMAAQDGLPSAALDYLAPPLNVYDGVFRAAAEKDLGELGEEALYLTPPFGKILKP